MKMWKGKIIKAEIKRKKRNKLRVRIQTLSAPLVAPSPIELSLSFVGRDAYADGCDGPRLSSLMTRVSSSVGGARSNGSKKPIEKSVWFVMRAWDEFLWLMDIWRALADFPRAVINRLDLIASAIKHPEMWLAEKRKFSLFLAPRRHKAPVDFYLNSPQLCLDTHNIT